MEKKAQIFLEKQSILFPEKKIQIWYQDEARFGQKGIVSKIWTIQGKRPTRYRQNGFKSAYFIGAVDPKTGDKYSLIYDGMDTQVMNQFLKNIGEKIDINTQMVMFVDGAGWHHSDELIVPENITLYELPPYSPELNPIEQIWGYLKSNFLSGRVFKDMADIFDYGVRAWRELSNDNVKSICASRLEI